MEFFSVQLNIDFMGKRRAAAVISGILIAASIMLVAVRGLNFGIDFTGGTLVEAGFPDVVELNAVRATLENTPYSGAAVQYYGTASDVLIRVPPREGFNSAAISNEILEYLARVNDRVDMRRVEFVGPQVGDELKEDGGLAMMYALIGILIYVAFRFQTRFSVGAIAALVHDVIITVGFFAVTRLDFDLTVLAAILAVIGYSLNDTIVVYDRIRENFRKMRKENAEAVMNAAINQTLSRTIMTGVTTLLVLVALFFLGGEIIHGFAAALIVGILVGTYSSIYIASPVTLLLGVTRQDLMPVEKEGLKADSRP